jgi:antitoxin ParD1/3/4
MADSGNGSYAKMQFMIYGILCQSICFVREFAMPTRNVVLTERQANFIGQLVMSEHYQNDGEVLRLVALRDAAQIGAADFDAGAFRSLDSATALSQYLTTLTDDALGN